MATYSSILARTIPWTEDPGGLQSVGWQRVRHNRAQAEHIYFCILAFLHGMWDFSSPVRNQTHAACNGSMKSQAEGCQGSPLAIIFHVFSFSKKLPTLPGNHQAGNSSQRRKLHEASLRSLIPSGAKTAPSLFRKILGLRILAPINLLIPALSP